ncbi:MAG: pyruvate, phosphate dikinase [Proteobacteria bacterium]|nr:pyruvate, phosphate dikinase [Pseudomonadota bacterium]
MKKWVYSFQPGQAEGGAADKNLLGGKGANLAEMCALSLPVPAGFTISTDICTYFYDNNKTYPADLEDQVTAAMKKVEAVMGRTFGDAGNPLLVSVRSGAPISMPGMMDTVLNLGLNDTTVQGIVKQSGDARFAYDSYRRFIQMYADVVMNVPHHMFEDLIRQHKSYKGVSDDTDLTADDWQRLVGQFKDLVRRESGQAFPEQPHDQLWGAVGAVFKSWNSQRAITYRRLNDISATLGTAVNVQAMVFGNMGNDSATGVTFTRNPSTGENVIYGEFLVNAQGEDLVAGIRNPVDITKSIGGDASMENRMPGLFKQLKDVSTQLETHYRDMQDIEFTIEQGNLWLLQTRGGKRTGRAALKIAVDMSAEGLISHEDAILKVDPRALDQLLHPAIDPNAHYDVLTKGLPASPGAASGKIVFTADDAEKMGKAGEKVILVRDETSPEDIHGMHAAKAILTARGGMTSHAAVVARGMGRPCVCGTTTVHIDEHAGTMTVGGTVLKAGDIITLDGTNGHIIVGEVPMVEPSLTGEFARLMQWADDVRTMGVRANADTPKDAETARRFGAEGIGLCRTEHMFFEPGRINVVRQMILAEDIEARQDALDKLLPMQRSDFEGLFRTMAGLPVTIRLLDPPLHEFLPHAEAEIAEVASMAGTTPERLKTRMHQMREVNPMLGHRGCRLGISHPEIYDMQARAIIEAALNVLKTEGAAPQVEIMVPLVGGVKELAWLRSRIDAVAQELITAAGAKLDYTVGTMIELPRACITADTIAEQADFFSFGTNDLTQTTMGISRDDSGSFLGAYLGAGIFERDPFESIDVDGVGALVEMGITKGRTTKPGLKTGICGEHGGDPASIRFCRSVGLTYVSCSPFRVPVARLAAAQAEIWEAKKASAAPAKLKAAS